MQHLRSRLRWALPLLGLAAAGTLTLLLAGCGGDGGTGYAPPGSPPGPPPPPAPTYSYVQTYVFSAICVACHSGSLPPQGLNLSAANAPSIIGRASTEVPSLALIAPGDPATSYLILKVQGAPGILGVRMPYGGPYLNAAVIQAMSDWVSAGAPLQ